MRTGLLALCLLVLAGCAPTIPPPTEAHSVATSAQPPTSAKSSEDLFICRLPPPPPPKKVAYIIDASGSMADSFVYVKHELKRSIRSLRPSWPFAVVFSRPGSAEMTPATKLVPATEANKAKAYDFIDSFIPMGEQDPADAVKKAFEGRPDLIYILTDGEFPPGIAELIANLNPKKEVTVNTICFISQAGEPLMKKIAEDNNGKYKFVSEDDLKKQMTK
jgi:hypothetical protein